MDESGTNAHAVRDLPEHLVENIVARMPFPVILNARQLSKGWKLKFPSVVRQSSLSLPQYLAHPAGDDVVLYDPRLDSVKRMPMAMGRDVFPKDSCGSLLLAVEWYEQKDEEFPWIQAEATVMNVLTRESRTIVCPRMPPVDVLQVLLVPVGTDHYNLIICYRDPRPGCLRVTVYHSSSACWETRYQRVLFTFECAPVYKDGSWYYIRHVRGRNPVGFVRLDIRSGTETETPIHVGGRLLYSFSSVRDFVLRCGSDIMVVVMNFRNLIVFRLDNESSMLVEVSSTPIREGLPIHHHRAVSCVGSSNRVYLSSSSSYRHGESTVLLYVYDVNAKTWSSRRVPTEFSMDGEHSTPYVLDLDWNPFVIP